MISDLKTIFSKSPLPSSHNKENEKISYWLEKLFNQEKEEIEKRDMQASRGQKPEAKPSPRGKEQSIEEEGKEEARKLQAEKLEIDKNKLEHMVTDSNRVLTTISSVFPWNFFPTSITIETTRLTITQRQLFSSQAHSVDIKDISNVFIETGILFASVMIISRTFTENNIKIGGLWKNDAIFIRRIIEGLRMLIQENMDTTSYSKEELIQKLKELSTTKIVL